MERLEDRQMMAGDVAAYVQNGNLFINEATAHVGLDNSIRVTQLANGQIRVHGNGTLSDGTTSLVNGQAFQDFTVTGGLFVNFGGGQDLVVIGEGLGPIPTFGNVSIDLGVASAVGDADKDNLIVWALSTRGGMTVNTGASDDWVFLGGTQIGDGVGLDNLVINTGGGGDTATIKDGSHIRGNLDIQTYSSLAETDADTAYFDTDAKVDMDVNVRLGGGDDFLMVTDPSDTLLLWGGLQTYGSMFVDMGAGDDEVYIRAASIGDGVGEDNLAIFTGAGADDVTVDATAYMDWDGNWHIPDITGNLEIQTYDSLFEIDVDNVHIPLVQVIEDLRVRTGAGDDFFELLGGNVGDDLDFMAGDGHDTAHIQGYIYDDLMARMGEGNDALTLGNVWADVLSLLGEGGSDSLRKNGPVTQYNQLVQNGWEWINGRPTWWWDVIVSVPITSLAMVRR
jgi:hypothetical protein